MIKRIAVTLFSMLMSVHVWAQSEIRLAVYKAFHLPQEILSQFEQEHNVKLTVIKVGGTNEMLNKLILSRAHPIADVVFGVNNVNVMNALQHDILAKEQPTSNPNAVNLTGAVAMDYATIAINYDKKWFEEKKLPLPKNLEDLTRPEYKGLLVVTHPATSGPGLGFLMANIQSLGEEKAFEWWAKMRQNEVKVTRGWSEAYYTYFSHNGGSYPMVLSYVTSPAAEVAFSKGKYTTPPTGSLFIKGGVFQLVEGAAVLKGTKEPELAAKLIHFLQSPIVQEVIPENMWVYPAVSGTKLPEVFKFARLPKDHHQSNSQLVIDDTTRLVNRWIRVVLR